MVEGGIIVKESITIKVSTKIIMEEDLDVGYAIKITILAQNVPTMIGLTWNNVTLVELEIIL